MTTVALLGAGGKMGVRLASNLAKSPYEVKHVEVSEAGRQRLKEAIGVDCVERDAALADAEVVILAVPDALISKILKGFVDKLKPGTAVVMLDAAAPHAGELPERGDLTYFVTHPCHPSIFNMEPAEKRIDRFGGEKAEQHIVCALMQGPEEHYALCEGVARAIYQPVGRSHRCTVEQMAILEPALSETVCATFCYALRQAVDKAASLGVSREAAFDFVMGHLNIELAVIFEIQQGRLSDGALKAIDEGQKAIFQADWLDRVFDPKAILQSVRSICNG